MALKPESALKKDVGNHKAQPVFEHRHFAEIARIIAGLPAPCRDVALVHFGLALRDTNPRFDGTRFRRAVEAQS